MMIYQYTAAALASEHKTLAHPASADSIPTSANQEDHVSMGATSARHARRVLEGVERILAIELLVATQALDLRLGADGRTTAAWPRHPASASARRARGSVRSSTHLVEDREPGPDLAAAYRARPRRGPRRPRRGRRARQRPSGRSGPSSGVGSSPWRKPLRRSDRVDLVERTAVPRAGPRARRGSRDRPGRSRRATSRCAARTGRTLPDGRPGGRPAAPVPSRSTGSLRTPGTARQCRDRVVDVARTAASRIGSACWGGVYRRRRSPPGRGRPGGSISASSSS